MPRGKRASSPQERRISRYTYDAPDPVTPETGHTALIEGETVVELRMDNGWSAGLEVAKLPKDATVLVDLDPSVDPVLMWAGKRNRRDVSVLPLQRNEIVTASRIAHIVDRARSSASSGQPPHEQTLLFEDLEKALRDEGKAKRVEFYNHDEGWRNKLINGDSMQVIESLIRYDGLGGKVQMVYVDPPYGISYDSNFQQRIDSTKNDEGDRADDVLTIRAFRDTWLLGVHSYLSYLEERLYLCRELLADTGSIFVQINDVNLHIVRQVVEEVFGAANFVSVIAFAKTAVTDADSLPATHDYLIWYARDKSKMTYHKLWRDRVERTEGGTFSWVQLEDGSSRRMTRSELLGDTKLPSGSRRFRADNLSSQGETTGGSEPVEFEGRVYKPSPGRHWRKATVEALIEQNRVVSQGAVLSYKRFEDDFPYMPYTHVWDDTIVGTFSERQYVVFTNAKVPLRCIAMTTQPGDLVFDPTCGSGTTAIAAEASGRRWVTCDTSRVAINVARRRVLSSVFDQYRLRNGSVSGGFSYKSAKRVTAKALAYGLEAESVELVDQPEVDPSALRVSGPFEVLTLGRYSVEDWKGYLIGDSQRLENYVGVISRLYEPDASLRDSTGMIHAIKDGTSSIGISVGPISGRVTARQLNDAVVEARAAGLKEVHILGWAFEPNVGEVKEQLERESGLSVALMMIRPDTLADGLRVTKREELFSPLALPDIEISTSGEMALVELKGVAVFDRNRRTVEYKSAGDGYVAAWYLDEDYDGDCFVDSQMFFDFKKKPALERTLGIEIEPSEWTLRLTSDAFARGVHNRVAVRVVDVYGNETTVVRSLT